MMKGLYVASITPYDRENKINEEAMSLLTSGEDEHMAAIAQKLVIRQERQRKKAEQEQEQERQKRIAMNRLINGDNFGL